VRKKSFACKKKTQGCILAWVRFLSFSCSLVLSVFWHWHFSLGELLREGHSVLLAVPAARASKREKNTDDK
jgi:hypothetical protein